MKKYTIEYFLNKFENIPEDKWFTGTFHNADMTKFCALGHCREIKGNMSIASIESKALTELSNRNIDLVNDGLPGLLLDYNNLGNHPKERVINYLTLLNALSKKERLELGI